MSDDRCWDCFHVTRLGLSFFLLPIYVFEDGCVTHSGNFFSFAVSNQGLYD